MKTLPNPTKADVQDPARFEKLIAESVRDGFFVNLADARNFFTQIVNRVFFSMAHEPGTAPVLTADDKAELSRRWEAINVKYSPESGSAMPHKRSELTEKGLPLSLYEAAFQRLQKGGVASFEEALQLVCDENHTPTPRITRIFKNLFESEPELLEEERAALAHLQDVKAKISAARATAVGIFNTREALGHSLQMLRTELAELELKRKQLGARREKAYTETQRHLRKGAVIPWQMLADAGSAVTGFDFILGEVDRQLAERRRDIVSAEKQLTDFIASHEKDLAPAA